MLWTVSYRNASGEMVSEDFEAETRQALFAVLEGRGIRATRVEAAPARRATSSRTPVRFVVWAAVVASAAAVAIFAVTQSTRAPRVPAARRAAGRPASSAASARASKGAAAQSRAGASAFPGTSPAVDGQSGGARREESSDEAPQPAGEGAASEGDAKKPVPEPVFKNGTDQLISMATSLPEGVPVPPLPEMGEAETKSFIKSLRKPIEIVEGDSPAVRRIKEHVQAVRMDIAKVMEENPDMSFSDVLNEHRDIANHNTECRSDVENAVGELLSAGDVEGARRLRDAMNETLRQMGVPEVTMPVTPEERAAQGLEEGRGNAEQAEEAQQ